MSSDVPFTLVTSDATALIEAGPTSEERFQIKRIFQGSGAKLIRISFRAGQVMSEHKTNAPIFVQVLEGTILFRVHGEEIKMPAGAIIHVDPSVEHELEAVSDAHVLLTLCA